MTLWIKSSNSKANFFSFNIKKHFIYKFVILKIKKKIGFSCIFFKTQVNHKIVPFLKKKYMKNN